jgi:hypothetical protein
MLPEGRHCIDPLSSDFYPSTIPESVAGERRPDTGRALGVSWAPMRAVKRSETAETIKITAGKDTKPQLEATCLKTEGVVV